MEIAIRTATWGPAGLGRHDCVKDFSFNSVWNGRHYATKRIRLIFIEESAEIVVITVYTYYF